MEQQIESIRRFNRFYTRLLGLLNSRLLDSPLSLSEGRVLLEIGLGKGCKAKDLMGLLGVDRGYLSRMLAGLEKRGYIDRKRSKSDGRVRILALTPKGREMLEQLQARASEQVVEMLKPLDKSQRAELVAAMQKVEALLAEGGHLE